ncbi:hypothetical protein KAW48_03430, partial [candidate division WOR-3 bacterium]|nr:hypothetical protein [candidate division WOR-3 bacterium]
MQDFADVSEWRDSVRVHNRGFYIGDLIVPLDLNAVHWVALAVFGLCLDLEMIRDSTAKTPHSNHTLNIAQATPLLFPFLTSDKK